MDARRILFVIFDGLGDRPLTELGHKTPLEAARKPNLDWFATNGVNGLVDPIAPGIPAGSETSHLAMFRAGTEHRAALVLRGRGLSPKVTDTDPHAIGEEIREAEALEPAAKATAKAANAFTKQAHKILKDHPVNRARSAKGEPPANAVVLRGAGVYPDLSPIPERLHVKAAGIAGVALIRGMFRAFGIDVLDVKGATGGLDTDMIAKADAALSALDSHDLVILHVKAPDLGGHDGQASEKVPVIERLAAV